MYQYLSYRLTYNTKILNHICCKKNFIADDNIAVFSELSLCDNKVSKVLYESLCYNVTPLWYSNVHIMLSLLFHYHYKFIYTLLFFKDWFNYYLKSRWVGKEKTIITLFHNTHSYSLVMQIQTCIFISQNKNSDFLNLILSPKWM